jgi:MSHA biogenesis protein MshJ
MKFSFHQLQEKIDARNLRERALLLLCSLAMLFLLWDLVVQSGLTREQKRLTSELNEVSAQRRALNDQLSVLALALASDPNLEQKNRLQQLTREIDDINARLAGLTQGLIAADDLPKILQDMLIKTSSLRLEQMQTLPVEELSLVNQKDASVAGQPSAGIFKHAVVLRVSGTYFELLEFLQQLESSPWRFYWEQLDYRVRDYPHADILLRVYTLGAEKGALGV